MDEKARARLLGGAALLMVLEAGCDGSDGVPPDAGSRDATPPCDGGSCGGAGAEGPSDGGSGGNGGEAPNCRRWVESPALPTCNLHVAITGSDTADGSAAAPLRTIQHAVDGAVAGDHICVAEGDYDEAVAIGTSGGPSQLLAVTTTAGAVVRSFDISADHVLVDGFVVRNAAGAGIAVTGHHNWIRGNHVVDSTSYGIVLVGSWSDVYAGSTDNTVIGNRIERAHTAGIQVFGTNNSILDNEIWSTQLEGDADGLRFFGEGHLIGGNHIHDIRLSEAPGAHIDCFQTWGPARDVRFDSNYCDNPDDSMQGTMVEQINAPVTGLVFVNNVFRMGAAWYGPGININAKADQPIIEDVTIVNNTFARTGGTGQYSVYLTRVDGAVVQNNVFYDGVRPPVRLVDSTAVEQDYSLVYRTDGEPPEGTAAAHDVWQADPRFVAAAAGNYRLEAGSPAIDAGLPRQDLIAFDHAGTPRPQAGGWDVGAFEWSAARCE